MRTIKIVRFIAAPMASADKAKICLADGDYKGHGIIVEKRGHRAEFFPWSTIARITFETETKAEADKA